MIRSRKPHILIVEDEITNQIVMRCIIERAGYSCEIVDRGEIAIERVREKSYGMIFMDLELLGVVDGGQVTECIRAYEGENKLPQLPIVLISGTIEADDYSKFYNLGCNEVYTKPASPQQIESLLRHYAPIEKNPQNVAA